MAELVDAKDLKSFGGFLHAGSNPAPGTRSISFIYVKPVVRILETLLTKINIFKVFLYSLKSNIRLVDVC